MGWSTWEVIEAIIAAGEYLTDTAFSQAWTHHVSYDGQVRQLLFPWCHWVQTSAWMPVWSLSDMRTWPLRSTKYFERLASEGIGSAHGLRGDDLYLAWWWTPERGVNCSHTSERGIYCQAQWCYLRPWKTLFLECYQVCNATKYIVLWDACMHSPLTGVQQSWHKDMLSSNRGLLLSSSGPSRSLPVSWTGSPMWSCSQQLPLQQPQ